MSLTEGAISHMSSGDPNLAEFKPTLQVTELKQVQTKQPQPSGRFRLVLSDGSHTQQAMLATQINHLVIEGKLRSGSIVQLLQYTCTTVQGRMIVIILELVVVDEESALIGNPVPAQKPVTPVPSSANPSPQSSGGNSLAGRYAATNSPSFNQRPESGATYTGGVSYNMPKSNQNSSFHNTKPEVLQPTMGTYSRPQSVYQQPPPVYNNRGPVAKNEAPPRIIPIAALNPYQGRWTIKARVTAKGDLRHFNNPRGDGKVFSFDLLDSDGGEIRVTCFNAVADQFYPQIEPGSVYLISKGSLKPAQKNFNHLHHELEIFLENTSTIQPCYEDDNSIPRQQFHFRPISDVEGLDNNSVVDVIGLVTSISPAMSIMRKNGTETQKRSLHLKDTSGRSVELTLWGNFCNAEGQTLQTMCDSGACPVLAVKAGRVGDFNGKTLGTISTSQLFIEPDFPESYKLKEWFEKEGRNTPSVSLSREMSSVGRTDILKTISQIKDEKLGTSEKPDWITVYATITFLKSDNFCYTACPLISAERQCNKKVTNNGDGKWRCDKCDQVVDECDYRYILQLQIQDHTGVSWVTAFQECGEEIMGISAKDLHILKYEKQDDDEVAKVLRQVLFSRFVFKLKVKEEIFSDEQRVKSTVVKVDRVNYSSHSRLLLDLMEKHKSGNSTVGGNADSGYAFNGANDVATGNVENRQYGVPGSNFSGNNNYGIREPVVPANQATQYGNRYNSGYAMAGSFGYQLSCNSCGASGHSSANCPSIMSGPGNFPGSSYPNSVSSVGSVAAGECFKCHQTGHWARDCPNASTGNASYNNSAGRFRAY